MINPIRFLYERLTERIFGSIASSIGNAVSTSRIACQAEQQSVLEDLARKYEAEGKQQLADQLRTQAASLSDLDPARDGAGVLERLGCTGDHPHRLPSPIQEEPTSAKKSTRKRRSRLRSEPTQNDIDTSNEGGV